MDICDAEFDGGAVWWLCEPEVQVLAVLASLQEEDVVARMQIGKSVERRVVVVV